MVRAALTNCEDKVTFLVNELFDSFKLRPGRLNLIFGKICKSGAQKNNKLVNKDNGYGTCKRRIRLTGPRSQHNPKMASRWPMMVCLYAPGSGSHRPMPQEARGRRGILKLTVSMAKSSTLSYPIKRQAANFVNTHSLLLAPNRRILYCWRRTEGFFIIGAEQKDSLLLAPNRRILYYWCRTEGFFIVGAEHKDSLVLAPNRRIFYCRRRKRGFCII